jgi:hypothetical protein
MRVTFKTPGALALAAAAAAEMQAGAAGAPQPRGPALPGASAQRGAPAALAGAEGPGWLIDAIQRMAAAAVTGGVRGAAWGRVDQAPGIPPCAARAFCREPRCKRFLVSDSLCSYSSGLQAQAQLQGQTGAGLGPRDRGGSGPGGGRANAAMLRAGCLR